MIKILSLLILLSTYQCTLFSPREADPPPLSSSDSIADSYQKLFSMLEEALTGGDADKVGALLDNDFIFQADSLDVASLNATLRYWERSREILFLKNLLSIPASVPTGIQSEPATLFSGSDTVFAYWNYKINFISDTLIGRAEMEMRGIGGRWYIVKWTDRNITSGIKTYGYWHLQSLFR